MPCVLASCALGTWQRFYPAAAVANGREPQAFGQDEGPLVLRGGHQYEHPNPLEAWTLNLNSVPIRKNRVYFRAKKNRAVFLKT
jgi:hypothetical protein